MKPAYKTAKKYLWIAVVLITAALAAVLFLVSKSDKTSSVIYTEAEIMEQSRDKEYLITENGVSYAFRPDGILTVGGSGSTKSFTTLEEAKVWYLTELYKSHTGAYPENTEQLVPFRQLLNRVTKIEVMEGITELGDSSFAPFYYVESVSVPDSLQKTGTYVFLGTGQYAGKEPEMVCFDSEEDLWLRPEEEQGTVPARELLAASVDMGDNITGDLYENGVLVVNGYGSTYEFKHHSEMEQHIMDELHCVSRAEAELIWFDKVAEIIIGDGVERIGDNALASYKNVLAVHAGEIKELGSRAFFSCGIKAAKDMQWTMDLENTAMEEDSFQNCGSMPVIPAGKEEGGR